MWRLVGLLLLCSAMDSTSFSDQVETVNVVVRAGEDGRIHWSNVSKGIAETLAIDLSLVDPILPRGSIQIGSKRAALTLFALNVARLNINV